MKLNLDNCPICESLLKAGDTLCLNCHYAQIANEYFIDVLDRENYKKRLEVTKGHWNTINQILQDDLVKFGLNWKVPEIWSKTWKRIELPAGALNLGKSDGVELARKLWKKFEQSRISENVKPFMEGFTTDDHALPVELTPPVQRQSEKETEEAGKESQEVNQKLATWVSKLTGGTWDVVRWSDFLASLGKKNAQQDSELEAARDREIERQFLRFKTVSVSANGLLINERKGVVRQFIQPLDGNNISLAAVPTGRFEMGTKNGYRYEAPARQVNISEFYLGRVPITQAQWRIVAAFQRINIELPADPSYFKGDNHPVDSISWEEAVEFCARLKKHTGINYRLPTESEWEYACRAGSRTAFAFGENLTIQIANYDDRIAESDVPSGFFRGETIAAGSLGIANAFGLQDMHGNIWEWCFDEWQPDYSSQSPTDGTAWVKTPVPEFRVLRGGAWCNWKHLCRSSERIGERADRQGKLFYVGFRLAVSSSELPQSYNL